MSTVVMPSISVSVPTKKASVLSKQELKIGDESSSFGTSPPTHDTDQSCFSNQTSSSSTEKIVLGSWRSFPRDEEELKSNLRVVDIIREAREKRDLETKKQLLGQAADIYYNQGKYAMAADYYKEAGLGRTEKAKRCELLGSSW